MIARVFPRRTKATPTDPLAFIGPPPMFLPDISEVHVSVAFTWDMSYAEKLAKMWEPIAPVKMGGPAFDQPGGEFVPGRYLNPGYVITSRGCPNRCWFCSVWRREPELIELPIVDGHNVLDDNLLACSDHHINAVFRMLKRQKEKITFTGGLEAALLKPWHVNLINSIRLKRLYFAFDTPDDWEPLNDALNTLSENGFRVNRTQVRCYVLIGYPKDTITKARERLEAVLSLGIDPAAMLWRPETEKERLEREANMIPWKKLQRAYFRPAIMHSNPIEPANDTLPMIDAALEAAGVDAPK